MTVVMRSALATLVLVPMVLIGLGAANAARFNVRAAALEQSWSAAQSAGVSAAQLAPARASLRSIQERRVLAFLPYSVFSDALWSDPFGQSEGLAAQGQSEALDLSRTRAQQDLSHLQQLGARDYAAQATALASAHHLADYVRLARVLETEANQLDQLSQASGGLSGGLPTDVVDGVTRLQQVISAATSAQLSTDPATTALAHAQDYLKQQTPGLIAQHDAIANEVKAAGDTVQHRVDTRVQANQLLGRLPDLLNQATQYSIGGSYVSTATQAKSDVLTAEQAGDDGRMDTATASLKQAEDQLSGAVTSAQTAAATAAMSDYTKCIPSAPAQLIVIHTSTERLVAYNNGCPILNTLITTGRPGLRTDTGTFTIHAKYASYTMVSPWPKGSQFWYPTTVVHDAMQINPADGTFIHSAEWEWPSQFGPGSENGPAASHGCIHVQNGPLGTLYDWAQVGTTVIVPVEAQG